MTHTHLRFRLLLPLLLMMLLAAGTAWAESAAMSQLHASVDAVIQVLRQKDLPSSARRQQVSTIVRKRFDFTRMARSALGPNWRALSSDQRQHYTELFTKLMEATYMGRIDEYRNETVNFVGEQERGGRVMIDTTILSGGKSIPISYKLVSKGGQWLVYDVVIENVSLVRNYRSTYGDVYDREGYDGLVARMEQKINELQSGGKEGA